MTELERFSYHRSVAPILWAFVALASLELVVVHLLVALLWSRIAALAVSIVTLASVGWLVSTIASMKRLPVTLDGRTLVMRVGTLRTIVVPVHDVAGLRTSWDPMVLKAPGVRNLALIAYPNILVDLAAPVGGVVAIAHRLDDPTGFAAAIDRLARRG